jgi:hypothetical protein
MTEMCETPLSRLPRLNEQIIYPFIGLKVLVIRVSSSYGGDVTHFGPSALSLSSDCSDCAYDGSMARIEVVRLHASVSSPEKSNLRQQPGNHFDQDPARRFRL